MGEREAEERLVLTNSAKPKLRGGRVSDWTQAKADRFVEVVADTCNIGMAARAIRRSISNVYKQRERDASFRRAWDQALAVGYSRLEMMMLERALHGVAKTVTLKNGETTVMREYSDRVALTLLRMHRETATTLSDEAIDQDEYREACERVIARLERLREREDAKEAGALETKALALPLARLIAALHRLCGDGAAARA